MDKERIVDYLAALDDGEFAALTAEARGTDAAIRAAEQTGNWRQSMALKNQKLTQLIKNADENGHQR